jgi:Arc/MetJ-type ribon-helix-helix transcriptional regulator
VSEEIRLFSDLGDVEIPVGKRQQHAHQVIISSAGTAYARRPLGGAPSAYDSGMSDRKTRLTVTVDPHLAAYAEQLVEAGKAPSVSAVFNDALSEKERRDRRAVDRLKEIAAQADPDKVARMLAHIDAQASRLPGR